MTTMVIFLLLSWLIVQLVWLFFYRLRTRTVTTVDRQTDGPKIKKINRPVVFYC